MALTTPSALVSLLGAHGAGLGQGQLLAIPGSSDVPGLNSNLSVPSGFDGLCSTRVSADGQVVATMLLRPGFVGGYIEPRGELIHHDTMNDHGPSVCPGRGGLNLGCAVSVARTQRRRRRAASRPPRPRTAAAPGVGT
jgi:hypothetical protein